jgi:hypothetical protein
MKILLRGDEKTPDCVPGYFSRSSRDAEKLLWMLGLCFVVSRHDFSRAVNLGKKIGLKAPELRLSNRLRQTWRGKG